MFSVSFPSATTRAGSGRPILFRRDICNIDKLFRQAVILFVFTIFFVIFFAIIISSLRGKQQTQ